MSYDPTIGRFISEDPIAFDGGDANLYRYVGNSPTNATDPSGLAEVSVAGAFFGSIGNGLWNMGVGIYSLGHDLVTSPIDLVGTTFSSSYQPISYYGQASLAAQQAGTPWYNISGETALNAGTFGVYGLGQAGYHTRPATQPNFSRQPAPLLSRRDLATTVIAKPIRRSDRLTT